MSIHPAIDIRAPSQLYIGGAWHDATDGTTFVTTCPVTGEPLATLASAGPTDVDRAVHAAAQASRNGWFDASPRERTERLLELARRLEQDADRLALIDVVDNGSTIKRMRADVGTGVDMIRTYVGLSRELLGRTIPVDPKSFAYTLREPFGVVATIVPFNHPLMFAAQAVGAALSAGNTLVLKPSEDTCLSTLELAALADDLLPPGVLNVVTGFGDRCGSPLVSHPNVRKVHFKGSVPTGKAVMQACVDRVADVTLELGGKSPFIVFSDADLDAAVNGAVTGLNLAHQGQSCGSATRLFVHETLMDEFRQKLIASFESVQPGMPWEPTADMGSMVSQKQYDRVLTYIDAGKSSGARVLTGGHAITAPPFDRGLFIQPTIFDDVPTTASIASEEIFGPVTCLFPWSDVDEVVSAANGTEYGLTASIWTESVRNAHVMARRLESGFVWVNQHGPRPMGVPFGGYKQSGIGRERSLEELHTYTQVKTVLMDLVDGGPR